MEQNNKTTSAVRHPVVVVLGHVDHGKTTLLDYIRKTNVAQRESGGITQHLGAYEISWHDKKITFLDTPGHESFSKMRERGARVADVAILVVAADDGVKPQTEEAFKSIQKSGIPFAVAINKIDKPTAEPDRVKSELSQIGVLVEGWGGSVPVLLVSAKEGRGIEELLETILLLAELEEFTGDPAAPAEGIVIEAHLDSRRGPSATLLVTNGTLKKGDFILAGESSASVRILEDTGGHGISEGRLSSPVSVVGFDRVPAIGDTFRAFGSKAELEENLKKRESKNVPKKDDAQADVGVLLKADVAGSLEALSEEAKKVLPEGLVVKFFEGSAGEITEGDIKTIASAKAGIIVGFRVKIKPNVAELGVRFGITVGLFEIIYEALDWLAKELTARAPKKISRIDAGKLLVLKIFQSTAGGRVIGGKVREGKVTKDALFEVLRQGEVVGRGEVKNIERNKTKVSELKEGEEGGLLVSASRAIEERDILSFFYEREA